VSITASIVESTGHAPLHLRTGAALKDAYVSSKSKWNDERWQLDNLTRGSKASSSAIKWNIDLHDGACFTDRQHRVLLDTFKRLAWSLMAAPRDGARSIKPASFGSFNAGLKVFVRWMVQSGLRTISDLDGSALERLRLDLPLLLVSEEDADEDFEISYGVALRVVIMPVRLWQQRQELEKAGIRAMAEEPWHSVSAGTIAQDVATKAAGEVLPLPDEVSIPVMNSAHRMIGVPADDVVTLTHRYLDAYRAGRPRNRAGPGTSLASQANAGRYAIRDFRFSTVPGDTIPWHEPIIRERRRTIWKPVSDINRVQRLRQLILDVSNAAVVVIQSTTGIRVSEICSLGAGMDRKTGLPACVMVQISASGLNEVFLLRGELSKTEETPRMVEWVLGMRPRGSNTLPPAVRAIIVLERLWAPWREMKKSRDLILHFRTRAGLPKSGDTVSSISSTAIARGTKDFVRKYVDLSGLPDTSSRALCADDLLPYRDSEGTCIKTHQWRKTLAHFVFNTDSRLIPALAMQFQHISLAMTEQGYLQHNHVLFEAFDSVRAQETTSLLFELATGRSLIAGRMGGHLEEHIEPIRRLIAGVSKSDGWRNVLRFVIEKGMKLWFASYGGCLPLDPGQMRCHEVAGTDYVLNAEPNYATREPSLCAGCQCFLLDRRHEEFWKRRYIENWAAWRRAERAGNTTAFRAILYRANQAKALLHKLAVDINSQTEKAEELSNAP